MERALLVVLALCGIAYGQLAAGVLQIRISTAQAVDSVMVVTFVVDGTPLGNPVVEFGVIMGGPYPFVGVPQKNVTIGSPTPSQTIFKAWLRNLTPRQRYYYRVGDPQDGYSPEYDFVAPVNATRPQDTIPIKFAAVANIDYGATFQLYIPIITQLFNNENGMGLSPGNIANNPGDSFWNSWGRVVEPFSSRFPFLFAPGPLDLDSTGNSFNYENRFTMPGNNPLWWSYDFSLVHIVSVSSVHNYTIGSPQYLWLESDLVAANLRRNITPWITVLGYSAMYSGGGPDYFFRSQIEPLLHKYGVDICIWNGHHFAQTKPIHNEVFTEGGSGTNFLNPGPIHLLVGTGGVQLREGCSPVDWAVINLCTYGVTNITIDTNGTLYGLFRQIQIEHTFQIAKLDRRCPSDCSGHGNCSSVFYKCVCHPNWYGSDCSMFMRDEYPIPPVSDWRYFGSATPGWNTPGFNESGWYLGQAPIQGFFANYNAKHKQRLPITTLTAGQSGSPVYFRKEFEVILPTNNGSWMIEGRVFSTEAPTIVSVNNVTVPTKLLPTEYYWSSVAAFNQSIILNGTNAVGLYFVSFNSYLDASVEVRFRCQPFYFGENCDIFIQTTGTTGTTGILTTGTIDFIDSSSSKSSPKVAIGLGVGGGILLLALVLGGIVAFLLLKRKRDQIWIPEPGSSHGSLIPPSSGELGKDWEIDYKEIEIGDELGRGAFGVVFKARWRNADCVVKQMHGELTSDRGALNNFLKEAYNMKNLRPHPNICDLLGVCTKPGNPICIVTELLSEGSLVDLFNSGKIAIDSSLAVTIAKDIASGMSHLHKENILHCDLAARNLLVSLKGKDQYVIKVADFGLSHISESDNYNLKAEAKFPIRWSAPEVMTRGQVSKAADVWSFGVVVWEILEFEKPYGKITSNNEVMRKVCNEGLRLDRPTRIEIPDRLWEIMQSCWESDPRKRPTFQDLYKQLGELEAAMGKEQSPLIFISSQGGEYNYLRTPLDQQNYTRSPNEKHSEEGSTGNYKQSPWQAAKITDKDEDDYTQSPAPGGKKVVEEDNYRQTPAPKSKIGSEDNASNYRQTPGNQLREGESGYHSVVSNL